MSPLMLKIRRFALGLAACAALGFGLNVAAQTGSAQPEAKPAPVMVADGQETHGNPPPAGKGILS